MSGMVAWEMCPLAAAWSEVGPVRKVLVGNNLAREFQVVRFPGQKVVSAIPAEYGATFAFNPVTGVIAGSDFKFLYLYRLVNNGVPMPATSVRMARPIGAGDSGAEMRGGEEPSGDQALRNTLSV